MTSQTAFNAYGADLEKLLFLRTYPLAIRMLKSESEIPEGAIRPKKDRGEHYAICQVFSLARRQGMTVAMFLEDHWCFEPIIHILKPTLLQRWAAAAYFSTVWVIFA